MAFSVLILAFILFQISSSTAQTDPDIIGLGSSLHPTSQPAWHSKSGRFAFGFFPEGDGYRVGIWLSGASNTSTSNFVVWTAKRDQPVVSAIAKLDFVEGKIQLKLENGQIQTIAEASGSGPAKSASMLDNGNFVLYNEYNSIIWESFKDPTDTILGGQILDTGIQLISSMSQNDHSLGRFRLKMQFDGNLAAYPVDTVDDGVDCYWNTGTVTNTKTQLLLSNVSGDLQLYDPNTSSVIYNIATSSSSVLNSSSAYIFRAKLDYDGNFRLFTHSFSASGNDVLADWKAIDEVCEVKGFCGFNSYCTRSDGKPECICIPGFSFINPNRTTFGCERNITSGRCIGGREDASSSVMVPVNLAWGEDRAYFLAETRPDECEKSCLEDCDCDSALYSDPFCAKYKLPFKYLKNTTVRSGSSTTAFFKLNKYFNTTMIESIPTREAEKQPWSTILALSLSFFVYSCFVLAVSGIFLFKFHIMKYRKLLLEPRTTGLVKEFTLQTYTYSELKKATKDFKQELGKGSFGAVHKGTFDKGKTFVAVKRLEKVVEEGEREFRAEMKVIGRTRHKNLVRLLGYCVEGSQRLLVYEYMSNGSLADVIFKNGPYRLAWNDRVKMALDVARGMLYLHQECDAPIIHCDIKPQNILLDHNWHAKIADFGLAKLMMADQTRTLTGARGTRGYMAPEWSKNIPVSLKVDVYSFGIVLLEIICCRRNLEVKLLRPEEALLSAWAYRCFEGREMEKLMRSEEEEMDKKEFEKMVSVALWCIQEEPELRFPMKMVVLMLEGIMEVPVPPCPFDHCSS